MAAKGITILEGSDLQHFFIMFGTGIPDGVYRMRIWAQTDGSIKVKVNEGMWTYMLGKADLSA
jgi:hypothetical protein